MDINTALDALSALSQKTRLETFRLLVRAGPEGLSAGDIADALGTRQNTMSTHLKLLTLAGLVRGERDGRSVIYRAEFETMRALITYLLEDCCAGSETVCGPVAESIAGVLDNRC